MMGALGGPEIAIIALIVMLGSLVNSSLILKLIVFVAFGLSLG